MAAVVLLSVLAGPAAQAVVLVAVWALQRTEHRPLAISALLLPIAPPQVMLG